MMFKRLRFKYDDEGPCDGLAIDFYPADPRCNPIFAAAVQAYIQPLQFAQRLGRLQEESANHALAKAYAEGVVAGTPSPELENFTTAEWVAWFLEHPEQFAELRKLAEPEDLYEGLGLTQ